MQLKCPRGVLLYDTLSVMPLWLSLCIFLQIRRLIMYMKIVRVQSVQKPMQIINV